MKKYSTRDLSIPAKLIKHQTHYDQKGGVISFQSTPKNVWIAIEPIVEIRSLFSEGGGGVVKYDHPLYKVIINSEYEPQVEELILLQKQQLKILKIINLFQNNLLLLIVRGEKEINA